MHEPLFAYEFCIWTFKLELYNKLFLSSYIIILELTIIRILLFMINSFFVRKIFFSQFN